MKPIINPAQMSITAEKIVDYFAGGGGASIGIEIATGRIVDFAINHDPAAIRMHRTNHPYTKHLEASVWDVDPKEMMGGQPVGLAWFSPDCKHFSKAKGGKLLDKKIRGLAWIVLRVAGMVRPRVIIVENVEEFTTWGPLKKGKPRKSKKGQTFQKWLKQLRDLGYEVEYRELVAADYGAPTTRKRFVCIARCDGKPIVWPERTHAPLNSEEVKTGKCKPWRSAAEIIDWSLPCYSIFESKQEIKKKYGVTAVRPLADNTMRRIIRGTDKHTIKSGKPFIVPTGYGERKGQAPRVHDIEDPLPTVVSTTKHNLCQPVLAPITISNTGSSVGAPVCNPVGTVRTGGGQILVSPHIMQYHTEQKNDKARVYGLSDPLATVDAANRYGLVEAHLTEYYGNGRALSLEDPLHTVTTKDREALTAVHLQKYFSGVVGAELSDPLPTVTAIDHNALCASHLVKFKGKNLGQSPEEPLQTITAGGGEFALCHAVIRKMEPGAPCGYWPEIRALLNKYCDYRLADDEIILLMIGGVAYYIADICMRMLSARELYNAMGFPPDYEIDFDYLGNVYHKTDQVARCGNAVCPPMSAAVVRANFPEWCRTDIETMEQLYDVIAV